MHPDIHSGGECLATIDVVFIYIWCEDKKVAERIHTLLQTSLVRAKVTLLDTDRAHPWEESNSHYILISDHMPYIQRVETWLQAHPAQLASALYIVAENDSGNISLDGLKRYRGVQRLEKKNLHLCDTLTRGLMYPALHDHLENLESSQQKMDVLIDHIKEQLAIFYHNINNPLTVLSGNLQLLHILAESATLPNDIKKSIQDISEISDRFESDLNIISQLRERILQQEKSVT